MKKVQIENLDERGQRLLATFTPERGMNLLSFKKDALEVIDQKTMPLFEERLAGLGPLIGPHFHHRPAYEINSDFDTSLFPHIARVKAKGTVEPFSHGIARYVPWSYESSLTQIKAKLSSKSLYKGVPIGKFEGMEFEMNFEATMMPYGLFIRYTVESDRPSLIGLHTYYHLPEKKGLVIANVKEHYRKEKELLPIPNHWMRNGQLHFDLSESADFGFFPKDPLIENRIILKTSEYELHLFYDAPTEDHSWQLYHPQNESFVCLEPLSSLSPRSPKQTRSMLEIKIEIV